MAPIHDQTICATAVFAQLPVCANTSTYTLQPVAQTSVRFVVFSKMSDTDDCCAAIVLACMGTEKQKRKRKQRVWAKSWLLNRSEFSHARLVTELRLTSAADYKNYLRMDGDTFNELLKMVAPLIEKRTTVMREAISPELRLLATLRYLVSGDSFEELKFQTAIAAQTLGKVIVETCEALIHVMKGFIKIPASENEWKVVAQQFEKRWNFPHCIGAIDGKHITIRKPPGSGSYYFNYKHSFSIVLMAVVNANYEFIMVDVGANGRVSDGGVFSNTEFYKRLVNNKLHIPHPDNLPNSEIKQPYVLVADDAFPLMDNLMKPFSRKNLTREQAIFNYRLSRARRIVENAFGILASRFRILLREINLCSEKATLIVLACTHLHNFLRIKKVDNYNLGGFDFENTTTGEIVNADWKSDGTLLLPLQQLPGRNTPVSSKEVRLNFSRYFNSEQGAVSWQDKIFE